jgi:hypothetical protein
VFIFLQLSCKEKEPIVNFEKEVFKQVFLNVVDSTYQDGRIYFKFPDGTDIETRKALLVKDTSKLVFAIDEEYGIDLKNYNNHKFVFKNISEFPQKNKYDMWETKYKFGFAGAFYFYPIQFNSKESGIIKVSYGCGTRCGADYEVSIKKINNKWIVDKVIQTGSI